MGGQAEDFVGLVEDDVDGSIGSGGDVSDSACVFEDDFIMEDAPVPDIEQADFLVFEGAGEEVVFPPREEVASIEIQSAGGDGGLPVEDRLGHAFLCLEGGDGGAVIVSAVGDDGPAVIDAGADEVDLVAAEGAVLGLCWRPGAVCCGAERRAT